MGSPTCAGHGRGALVSPPLLLLLLLLLQGAGDDGRVVAAGHLHQLVVAATLRRSSGARRVDHVVARRQKLPHRAQHSNAHQTRHAASSAEVKKRKGSRWYSTVERRVPQLVPVLGSQPAGNMSHKPGGRLPLLSARPAVTLAALKRAATNFAAW